MLRYTHPYIKAAFLPHRGHTAAQELKTITEVCCVQGFHSDQTSLKVWSLLNTWTVTGPVKANQAFRKWCEYDFILLGLVHNRPCNTATHGTIHEHTSASRNSPQCLPVCSLPRPQDSRSKPVFFLCLPCLSVIPFHSGSEAHFIVSVRCEPVVCLHSLSPLCQALTDKATAPAPISLLQLRWLLLDSVPPLISSSEISLHGSRGLVVGRWGLEGCGGVRSEEAGGCMWRRKS